MGLPALLVQSMGPVLAASFSPPLPPADGFPVLRVLWASMTPGESSAPLLSARSASRGASPEFFGSPKFFDVSFHTCHALGGPRQTLRA